jgi:four helix bundle protein
MTEGKRIQNFRDLIVWQKSRELAVSVYRYTKLFPEDEIFCLVSQMRRAVISVSSNIAEGFGRTTAKDRVKFYGIARGSLLELESQVLIAESIGYISEKERLILEQEIWEVSKILSGLIRKTNSLI